MSEPEEIGRGPDDGGVVGGADQESAAESGAASEPGVGLGVGEPNTFEPEEAGPAADNPDE